MGQQVIFSVDAKHEKAIAAFLAVNRAIDQTAGKGAKAGDELERAGEKSANIWQKGLNILASYPATFGKMLVGAYAIQQVIGQISAEIERFGDVREKAYSGLKASMGPYLGAAPNIPDEYRGTRKFQELNDVGINKFGGPAGGYFNMLGGMFSSAGPTLSPEEIHNAANVMAEARNATQLNDEDSAEIGAAMLRIMNIQKERGQSYDPKEILGAIYSTFESSPSRKAQQYAMYGLKSVQYMMQFQNSSFEEAAAAQATYASKIGDVRERKAGTGLIQTWEKLDSGYAKARAYGLYPGGAQTLEDWKKLTPEKKVAAVTGQDEEAIFMRAYLKGNRSDEPAVLDAAAGYFGIEYEGAAFGEAGIQSVAEDLLKAGSDTQNRMAAIKATIKGGSEAVKKLENLLKPLLLTPQEKAFANIQKQESLSHALDYNNVQKANEGAFLALMTKMREVSGTSATADYYQGLWDKAKARKASPKEMADLEIEAAKAMRDDVAKRGQTDIPYSFNTMKGNQLYRDWLLKKGYPTKGLAPGYNGGSEDPFRYDPRHLLEYKKEHLIGADRGAMQALDAFIEGRQEVYERGVQSDLISPDKAPERPGAGAYKREIEAIRNAARGRALLHPTPKMLPRGGGIFNFGGPPSDEQADAELTPGERLRLKTLERKTREVEGKQAPAENPNVNPAEVMEQLKALIDALSNQTVRVSVNDSAGRFLSRTTSRPRALDLLDDSALG